MRPIWISLLATLFLSASALAESKPAATSEKSDAHAKEGDAEPQPNAESLEPSNVYVHRWLKTPSFRGPGLGEAVGEHSVDSVKGRATVVIFLASWCEPCQQMIQEFRTIEKRYRRLSADFVFVFAHDTKDDAQGFMREFGIEAGMLATHDVLKAFHNPELPTIYVGDRHGWLATRYVKAGAPELKSLDGLLRDITAI